MVFFAFHQYLATNFHLNISMGIVFLFYLPLEMMYQNILFQIFQQLSLILFFAHAYVMQERSHNISHLCLENPSQKDIWLKFRPSFTKFWRNLMISIFTKVRLEQLRKAKYSILASILLIFLFYFLQSLISTCTIQCVNLMVFLYLALNLETFQKRWLFGKIHFLILFWTRSLEIAFLPYLICSLEIK